MIIIVDDYLLLTGSLLAMLWGMARFFLINRLLPKGVAPDAATERALAQTWLSQSGVIILSGIIVLFVVGFMGTENTVSRVISLAAFVVLTVIVVATIQRGFNLRASVVRASIVVEIIIALLFLIGGLYVFFIR